MHFKYDPAGDYVLEDVSFSVESGESLAIVGATGSGKTTVVNLLCRFYDVQEGSIKVDGRDVREWPLEDLRRRFGIVQQDVFLFSGDIESNIRLRERDISSEQVRAAARNVNADRFIERLPRRFQQPVAEGGVTLSSGQRQLLSFARALAFDPDILVLDEATANIDTETEHLIQDAIARLMRERTSIVIAHRLSTIRNADKIVVVDGGRITQMGKHEELLEQDGLYAHLYALNYSDAEASTEEEAHPVPSDD